MHGLCVEPGKGSRAPKLCHGPEYYSVFILTLAYHFVGERSCSRSLPISSSLFLWSLSCFSSPPGEGAELWSADVPGQLRVCPLSSPLVEGFVFVLGWFPFLVPAFVELVLLLAGASVAPGSGCLVLPGLRRLPRSFGIWAVLRQFPELRGYPPGGETCGM